MSQPPDGNQPANASPQDGRDAGNELQEPSSSAAATTTGDSPHADKSWNVPMWLKGAFTWLCVATVGGLGSYKVVERLRYESILIDTVMDAVPMSQPAPGFTLTDGAGKTPVSLQDLRGKYVFVNFWATWCPPCREEMPSLEYLTRKYKDKMAFVAITVDEDWKEVGRFFGPDAPSFTVLWDPKRTVTRDYGSEKFPESYLVDPQGRIVAKFVGPRDWNNQASEEYFRKLLGG